jgi:hypothetical protein
VNLLDFYSFRLIGKLTDFFYRQEFVSRNLTVDTSTSVVSRSPHTLNHVWTTFSPSLKFYGPPNNPVYVSRVNSSSLVFSLSYDLLKKDTKEHVDGWEVNSKVWSHMVMKVGRFRLYFFYIRY